MLLPKLALPLALLLGSTSCIAVAHSDYSAYEETYEVVALKHATAADVASTLSGLGQSKDDGGRWKPVHVSVDARTNSLVLRGQAARVDEMVEVIRKLDVKVK